MQKMVVHWMERYEHDVEDKQKQLDELKQMKAKDLNKLRDLTKTVNK